MSDQLVHVRDKSTGEEGYIGADWLTRWPDDFAVIDDSKPAPTPAAAPAVPAASPEPGSTGNQATQF